MKLSETAVREHLRQMASDLESLGLKLLGIQASLLEESPIEAIRLLDFEEQMDAATEIHTGISCLLTDWIAPALESLRKMSTGPEAK